LTAIEPVTGKKIEHDQMSGFAKGLSVIEAFGDGRNSMSIADVARRTGLDRAVARRCLNTLVNAGYAASDGKAFVLTPKVLKLANAFASAPLPRLVQAALDVLADELRHSCSASVLDGDEVLYIARATRFRTIAVGLSPGSRLPAYVTSVGRVLLSALPTERARSIIDGSRRLRLTPYTKVETDEIMTEIAAVRDQDFAIIDQELELNSRAVAVPLRNHLGAMLAAINVAGHVSELTLARIAEVVIPRLRKLQAEMRETLP
jgi:IclR family pca regulon transcriptional regulator